MQKKILHIDNGADSIRIVKTILESEGHTVYTACNEQSCLFSIKNEKPDLVLLEVMMGNCCGWELYQKIKKINKNTKVAFLSSIPISEERKQDLLNSGIADYILKPIKEENLLQAVNSILS